MGRASLWVLIVTLCTLSAAGRTEPKKQGGASPEPQARATTSTDSDADAMRADLARMRNLVTQMQRNLGFVDSGLTPLKHQFELEIEMWNVLINDMQRRLNAQSERVQPPTASPSHPQ